MKIVTVVNLVTLAVMTFSPMAFGSSPKKPPAPLEFRGYAIGMPQAEACRLSKKDSAEVLSDSLLFDTDIRGVHTYLYIKFISGKLQAIEFTFNKANFPEMVKALAEKYGKPTFDLSENFQNAFGATVPKRLTMWERPDGKITALEFAEKIDRSQILITSKEMVDAAESRARSDAAAPGF